MLSGADMYNIWDQGRHLKKQIEVSCFLPTGVVVLLKCSREETITNIKRNVWKEARNYPFFNQLLDTNFYVFQCINQSAEQEELLNEKRRLCDVKPFTLTLRLVLKSDNVEENVLTSKIGLLIGKSLHEFNLMKNAEVDDFRLSMKLVGVSIQKQRAQWDWEQKARFLFPTQLVLSLDNLPEHVKRQLEERRPIVYKIWFNDDRLKDVELEAGPFEYPADLVRKAVTINAYYTTKKDILVDDYVLKIRGKEEYLLGNEPLNHYKYIREMMNKSNNEQKPELTLVHRGNLRVNERLMDPLLKKITSFPDNEAPPVPPRVGTHFSTEIHQKVRIQIHRAWNVNMDHTNPMVIVRAGIFHGVEQLGPSYTTVKDMEGPNPEWNEWFGTDTTVSNLPRTARLCLLICTSKSTGKFKKKGLGEQRELIPVAWANTTFFDYKNHLKMGSQILNTWPALEDADLNPMGTVESNPHIYDTTSIEISFGNYSKDIVSYPPLDKLIENPKVGRRVQDQDDDDHKEYINYSLLEELRKIVDKDPLEPLEEHEKEQLWKARHQCREHTPHFLPRLLQCVQWDSRASVVEMQTLLEDWPVLKPEEAMELLDYKYADITVRKFAVLCLEKLTENELSQYLLQLVQALKYETHLDCDLGRFLLRRALNNQRIGHFFFWHLRAEMHNSAVSTRFGLLLEAYCRGNITHMRILTKQVESLGKMKMVNELIKLKPKTPGQKSDSVNKRDENMQKHLMDILKEESFSEALSQLVSPLSPSDKLMGLKYVFHF